MIAMAMRGGCGFEREDFDLVFVFGVFTILSQYTAKVTVDTRLAASQTADKLVLRGAVALSG
jgi:hypothetical protein